MGKLVSLDALVKNGNSQLVQVDFGEDNEMSCFIKPLKNEDQVTVSTIQQRNLNVKVDVKTGKHEEKVELNVGETTQAKYDAMAFAIWKCAEFDGGQKFQSTEQVKKAFNMVQVMDLGANILDITFPENGEEDESKGNKYTEEEVRNFREDE